MAIYDYICSNCGNQTEIIHAIHAPAPRYCPVCGTEDSLRKVFVAPTVVFKGSGWAKKDRSGASRPRTKDDHGVSKDGKDAGSTGDAAKGSGGSGAGSDGSGGSGTSSTSSTSGTSSTPGASSAANASGEA